MVYTKLLRLCLFVFVCIGLLNVLRFNLQFQHWSTSYFSSLSYYDETTTFPTTTTSTTTIIASLEDHQQPVAVADADVSSDDDDDETLVVKKKNDITASSSSSLLYSSKGKNDDPTATTTTIMQQQQQQQKGLFPLRPLPRNLVKWNLPSSTTPSSSSQFRRNNFTKSVCTKKGYKAPFPTILEIFKNNTTPGWEFILEAGKTDDPECLNSRIRILWEGNGSEKHEKFERNQHDIAQHTVGEQLTASILGARVNKELLWILVQNSSNTFLKDSLPTTRTFDSTASCQNFCNNEWLLSQQQQPKPKQWIWKPKNQMQGRGIVLVGETTKTGSKEDGDDDGGSSSSSSSIPPPPSLEGCRDHCKREGGKYLTAQEAADAMLLPDGRKFDVRSHLLIANVNPLVIFAGHELVRACAEPMNATNPEPFPGIPSSSSWNPFQRVCNNGLGKKHPTPGVWTKERNTGTLEKGIPDQVVRSRVLSNLDEHNSALIELLRPHIDGQVGMFQILAVDYLVDNSERITVLEVNDQPGFVAAGETWYNPWYDIFDIEWTVLETYHQYQGRAGNSSGGGSGDGNNSSTWEHILRERLSTLDLDGMRMLPPL